MVATVRHKDITNTTDPAALMTSGNEAIVCNTGQDYGLQTITRTFITEEIGTGAGETQDTTSDPTMGFLFAQFQGCSIKQVITWGLFKDVAAEHTTVFERLAWSVAGLSPDVYNLGFRIVNPSDNPATPGWSAEYASLYLLDAGDNADSQIADGDKLKVLVELGAI